MVRKSHRAFAAVTADTVFFFEKIYKIFLFGIDSVKILYPEFSVHKTRVTHNIVMNEIFTGNIIPVCYEVHKLFCLSPYEIRCSARCYVRYGKMFIMRLKIQSVVISHERNIHVFQ